MGEVLAVLVLVLVLTGAEVPVAVADVVVLLDG